MTRISKTLTAAALACGLALSTSTASSAAGMNALASLKSAAPQSPIVDVHGRRGYRRGRNVGLAILGAAAAAAIVSGAARAERYRYRLLRLQVLAGLRLGMPQVRLPLPGRLLIA
jgi:cysteine sulfinate desulfinase/cysteine desulfurase-like protein